MSNYYYEIGEEIAVSDTQSVRVIKGLAQGWTQEPDSDYIQQTADNRIEVYEVETIRDSYAGNIGNHEIVVSDNASCWLWGCADGGEDAQQINRDHVQILDDADIPPSAWVDEVESKQLRDYVRDCVADCWPYWDTIMCDECNNSDNITAPYEDELTAWYRSQYSDDDWYADEKDNPNRITMWDVCYNGPAWHAAGAVDRNPYDRWCETHNIADYMHDGEVDCEQIAYDYMQDDFAAYDAEIRAEFRKITGVNPEDVDTE